MLTRIKFVFGLLFILLISNEAVSQNLLPEKLKFKPGDNPQWAIPEFDDTPWAEIMPGQVWERQGYATLDGFAWYRITINIPSRLRKDAGNYGGFILSLGKIDDADQTFFNGKLLGKTGELPPNYSGQHNTLRAYSILPEMVRWDQPNTIAVRVYDHGGDGGIYASPIHLIVRGLSDHIDIAAVFSQNDRVVTGKPEMSIPLQIYNTSNRNFRGALSIIVVSDFGDLAYSGQQNIIIRRGPRNKVSFTLPAIEPGFYKANIRFESELASKQAEIMFGYEPEKIVSPPNPQPDFDLYWQRAKRELAAVDPQYRMIRIDSLCTERREVFLVEMRSLGNVLVRGWYSRPVASGTYPAVLQVQGYGTTMSPAYIDYGDDIIGFGLNIRGHGNSKHNVNPGFPGYILHSLHDKEMYIYRGAYMDCIRAVDFLFSRPEVDTTRVAVEGASQGGALSFATAALDNERIKVCVPQVPFLADFEDYFKTTVWPANEFINLVESQKKLSWEQVFYTLSYIDIKNLAGLIKAPMLMGVGLKDEICPPHINFAAYNLVNAPKQYIVYPFAGHALPNEFHFMKMNFIRKHFGLK